MLKKIFLIAEFQRFLTWNPLNLGNCLLVRCYTRVKTVSVRDRERERKGGIERERERESVRAKFIHVRIS